MDNYNNNQGQQYNAYGMGQPQYNQYDNMQQQYNPYGNVQQLGSPYENMQPQYNPYNNVNPSIGNAYNQQPQMSTSNSSIKSFINISMILGLVGSIILFVGLMLPAVDFSYFHQSLDIQYNLFKVGKNVGLISAMWNVIPYALLIGIILLAVISFVRIPVLKVLPIIFILCMFVLMLVDMGNIANWAKDTLDELGIVLEKEISKEEIFKSIMPGVYIMVVGIVVSLVSCFVKIKEN